MIPHPTQEEAISFIVENKSVMLKAPVGAGKTIVATESFLRSGKDTCLVVAPLNTRRGWEKTITRQSQGAVPFRHITTKKDGVAAYSELAEGKPGMYFIGWELMRTLHWEKMARRIGFVVGDECHRHTNRNSQNHKMYMTLKGVEYKLDMSDTVWGNKVEGAWAIARFLWPTETIRGFWNWVTKYLKQETEIIEVKGEERSVKKILGERQPGRIWADLPAAWKMPSVYTDKPVIHEVEVELNPTQRKHYKELETEAVTFLDENPLIPELPGVMYMRLMEMTLAVPSIKQDWIRKQDKETGEWFKEWGDVVYFEDNAKSSKADAVIEILNDLYVEKTQPVLVLTHSKKFATFLTKRLQSKGFEARQFIGGMSDEEREWKLDAFGKEYDVMVATIPAIAEGTDGLQDVCNIDIWVSVSDNRVYNRQGRGRVARQGQKKTVQRYVIRAANTVEVKQAGRLIADQQIMDESLGEELELV